MKYRADFVTNSSSSSSVILLFESEKEHMSFYHEFSEPGYWYFSPMFEYSQNTMSYHGIVKYMIINFLRSIAQKAIEIRDGDIEKDEFENPSEYLNTVSDLINITMSGECSINEDAFFKQKGKVGFSKQTLILLNDLDIAIQALKIPCESYEDFTGHVVWDLSIYKETPTRRFTIIKERIINSSDDAHGSEQTTTTIYLKSLRIKRKELLLESEEDDHIEDAENED